MKIGTDKIAGLSSEQVSSLLTVGLADGKAEPFASTAELLEILMEPESPLLSQLLSDLQSGVEQAPLTVDSPRKQWTKAVSAWLSPAPQES